MSNLTRCVRIGPCSAVWNNCGQTHRHHNGCHLSANRVSITGAEERIRKMGREERGVKRQLGEGKKGVGGGGKPETT